MKKLEQIRQESKEIKDKIDDTEERLRQLKKSRTEDIKTRHRKNKKRKNSQTYNKGSNIRKYYRKSRRTKRWRKNPT